jgi:hypothetical protein
MSERKGDWTGDPSFLPPAILTLISVVVMISVSLFDLPGAIGLIGFICLVGAAVWIGVLVSRRARQHGVSASRASNRGAWEGVKHFFKSLP